MPQSYDEDDVESDCNHCECWSDGGDCCDCGMENSDYDDDDDDNDDYLPNSTIELAFDDDGSEETKDEE